VAGDVCDLAAADDLETRIAHRSIFKLHFGMRRIPKTKRNNQCEGEEQLPVFSDLLPSALLPA
jgi:hypothetical protein